MTVFVDTSGLYAVFDRDDRNHAIATQRWRSLLSSDARLVSHNYVVLELTAQAEPDRLRQFRDHAAERMYHSICL